MGVTAVSTPSLWEEFVSDFKRLGFTEYETRVYIQLLRQSPATAYEIAKASGVPRPNTYNALQTLTHRGSVLPVSENPVRYVAMPPDKHLDTLGRQTMAVCDSLVRRLEKVSHADGDPYVWAVHGEREIREKVDAMFSEARRSIRIKAADDDLRPHVTALRAAARRGVDILIVLFGTDPDEFRFTPECQVHLHEGNGVRMGTADNLFTLTIDQAEMLTTAIDEMTASYTRNPAVVKMADSLVRHDYYMAEIYARFGEGIDEAFGPFLRDLRMRTFSPDQVESFREKTGLR